MTRGMARASRIPLVLATRNPGKVREMRHALRGLPYTCISAEEIPGAPEVKETAATLRGNALKKAKALARWAGLAALADDTGLEVTALGGRPGVHSARYAGAACRPADNIRKLLRQLRGVPASRRAARFRCVIALARPTGRVQYVEGVCEGRIAERPSGAGGFGYDPVFIPKGSAKTFAQLSVAVKNRISHRGKALRRMRLVLGGGSRRPS